MSDAPSAESSDQPAGPLFGTPRYAVGVTVVYGVVMVAWVVVSWTEFAIMEPNAWGDWLAGIAAPLAFFWFVVAYRLQSRELRLNTEELQLVRRTHQERTAVDRESLALNRSQITAEIQPRFRFLTAGGPHGRIRAAFNNEGGVAHHLCVYLGDLDGEVLADLPTVESGEEVVVTRRRADFQNAVLTFSYKDRDGGGDTAYFQSDGSMKFRPANPPRVD